MGSKLSSSSNISLMHLSISLSLLFYQLPNWLIYVSWKCKGDSKFKFFIFYFFLLRELGKGEWDEVTHIITELRERGSRRQSYKLSLTHLFKMAYLFKRERGAYMASYLCISLFSGPLQGATHGIWPFWV
jgi:hypothetical protein